MIIFSKLNITEKYLEHIWVSLKSAVYFQCGHRSSAGTSTYTKACFKWSLLLVPPQPKHCTDLSKCTLPAQHENQLQLVIKERERKGKKRKRKNRRKRREEERERTANQTHLNEYTLRKTKESGRGAYKGSKVKWRESMAADLGWSLQAPALL